MWTHWNLMMGVGPNDGKTIKCVALVHMLTIKCVDNNVHPHP